MDVTAEGVFQRLVVDRLGGSYCFGLNTLLLEVLKGLGFLYVITSQIHHDHRYES